MANVELRKAPCRAKDPSLCPYHGAILRMETAAKHLDLDTYFEERKKVEAAEANEWVEDQLKEKDYTLTTSQIESALRDYDPEHTTENYSRQGVAAFEEKLEQESYRPKEQRKRINLPGVGDVALYDSKFGEENGGSNIWVVFEIGGRYFQINGTYSSWDGEDWYSDVSEVVPTKEVITQVSTKYKYL